MKKSIKSNSLGTKLILQREVIARLTTSKLAEVRGGFQGITNDPHGFGEDTYSN